MSDNNTLLIELGCEELPAKALVRQAELLSSGMHKQLVDAGLMDVEDGMRWLATPRRLAVMAENVMPRQADRKLERKGPAEKAACDAEGNPTRAAEGFARSVGLDVDKLDRLENEIEDLPDWSDGISGQDEVKELLTEIKVALS